MLKESKVDERCMGELLANLTRDIANGMMKEYGCDYDSTRDRIRRAFLSNFDGQSAQLKEIS